MQDNLFESRLKIRNFGLTCSFCTSLAMLQSSQRHLSRSMDMHILSVQRSSRWSIITVHPTKCSHQDPDARSASLCAAAGNVSRASLLQTIERNLTKPLFVFPVSGLLLHGWSPYRPQRYSGSYQTRHHILTWIVGTVGVYQNSVTVVLPHAERQTEGDQNPITSDHEQSCRPDDAPIE